MLIWRSSSSGIRRRVDYRRNHSSFILLTDISGFRRCAGEIFSLVRCCAPFLGSLSSTFRDKHSWFGPAYRSHHSRVLRNVGNKLPIYVAQHPRTPKTSLLTARWSVITWMKSEKDKGLPQQADMAQGVPGRLRPRIFLTFGTTRVVGRQPYAPAAFTPEEIPGTHF
jgi:hypothetical protein